MDPARDLPSGVDPEALAEYAAIARALSGARHVLLLLLAPGSEPSVAFSHGFHAGGVDAGAAPDAQALLCLHPGDDDAPVYRGVGGHEGCGVALRDPSGEVAALLCLLRDGGFPSGIEAALRRLGRRLADQLFTARLADAMRELAWSCDAEGAVTWCNRAFAERFHEAPDRAAFLARWASGSADPGGECLVPVRPREGRGVWFATHRSEPRVGFATDVTERLDAQIALGRLGPLRESRGSSLLALDRVVVAMAERIGDRLPPGLTPRVRNPGDTRMTVRCDPHLLESALLDAALACATAMDAQALTVTLGVQGGHAVLGLECQPVMPDPATLPMLQPLLDACGGRLEPKAGAREAGERDGALRVAMPLHQPAGAKMPAATPAHILVVDDEAVVRMLVVDLLRERGHSVQEAEDAFAAMALVQQGVALDLMITDIGLPGGFDGSTLARRTRQLRPGLPILFITGYAFGTNNDVVLEPGIPVLTKPFTLGALAARIAELLEAVAPP
ncbi:response regulator [Lichenicoccus sp.]|uniref:response regulator n=1 Tax=Lichenicoccus sp. TaxID=2781899 RepID=UPI003D10AA8F